VTTSRPWLGISTPPWLIKSDTPHIQPGESQVRNGIVVLRDALNAPVHLSERAPNILICTAARPLKLAGPAAPNGGYRASRQPRSCHRW
jgi:hypothetical protein